MAHNEKKKVTLEDDRISQMILLNESQNELFAKLTEVSARMKSILNGTDEKGDDHDNEMKYLEDSILSRMTTDETTAMQTTLDANS